MKKKKKQNESLNSNNKSVIENKLLVKSLENNIHIWKQILKLKKIKNKSENYPEIESTKSNWKNKIQNGKWKWNWRKKLKNKIK